MLKTAEPKKKTGKKAIAKPAGGKVTAAAKQADRKQKMPSYAQQLLVQREAELKVINSIQQGLAAQLDFQAIVNLVGDEIAKVFRPLGNPEMHSIFIALYNAATGMVEFPYWMSATGKGVQ